MEPDQKPKKKKSDNVEKGRRIRIIQEWILQDFLTSDIVNQSIQKWGISERQAMRYVAEANDSFAKITEKNLEKRVHYHIQRRKKLMRDMAAASKNTPQGTAAQLNILEDIAKLERLYTIKIEHGGIDGQPLAVPVLHITSISTGIPIKESLDEDE